MKSKKSFKAFLLAVVLLLLTGLTVCGALPLVKQIQLYNSAQTAVTYTTNALSGNIKCFRMKSADLDKMELLKDELSQFDGFLGAYQYPDTELVSTIRYGEGFTQIIENSGMVNGRQGFFPYTYNAGLNQLDLLRLQEGEMFAFRPYAVGEEVPVVVTENDYFQVGDKIKLDLNVTNGNVVQFPNAKPICVDAYVCGIVKKDVCLPALQQDKYSATKHFSKANDLIWVFLPDLSEYTKLFDYQPIITRDGEVAFYALYKNRTPEQFGAVVEKYGAYNDERETMNTLGWALEREMRDFQENRVTVTLGCMCTAYAVAAACLLKEIVMVFYKKKGGDI